MKSFLPFTVLAVLLYFLAERPSPARASLSDGFERFQDKMKELTDTVASKTKSAFEHLKHSDFSIKTRNWFKETFQKLKTKIEEGFTK